MIGDLIERLNGLSTCQISDALLGLGRPPIGLVGIHALAPARNMAGRALTVTFGPADQAGTERIEYLEAVRPGDVLMIANDGRLESSAWGGQRSIGAQQRGAVGTVVDGAYRDVEENVRVGYPLFGRAATVAGSRSGPTVPVAVHQPVVMAGLTVHNGDYVIGDASGVIVVASSDIEAVIDRAETLAEQERVVTLAVGEGAEFLSYRAQVRAGERGKRG